MSARKPRLYFSFRSPFSWFALRLLQERMPDADEKMEFIPFFEPDAEFERMLKERHAEFHYVPMSKAKHLYILQDTKRLAARHGYPMKWPIDVGQPWWVLPHLGWLKARRLGVHREFYDAVTAARWERGEDICEADVLRRVLTDAGLDADTLIAATDDPEIRQEALEALELIHKDDVFGVPYFKAGFHRFWGLDRLDAFLTHLGVPPAGHEDAAAPGASLPVEGEPLAGIPAEVRDSLGSMDHDTAGGCG